MKKFYFIWCLAAAVLLTGCPAKENRQTVCKLRITTEPAGAEVFFNGKSAGVTPLMLHTKAGHKRFRLEKAGFKSRWADIKVTPAQKVCTAAFKLEEQGCGILAVSEPSGAAVSMQGKNMGMTPLVIPGVMPGKYELSFSKPGYAAAAASVTVTGLRPQKASVKLIPDTGMLEITSSPDKAMLKIDGKDTGFTPYKGSVMAGVHRITLEKTGYLPLETSVEVNNGGSAVHSFSLTPAPGVLKITTVPAQAQIFLNGRMAGSSPLTVNDIAGGKYEIKAVKEGYDTASRSLELVNGSIAGCDMILIPSTGEIQLSVIPAGVQVMVDGKPAGEIKSTDGKSRHLTELFAVKGLAPGEHQVVLFHPRAVPARRTVAVHVRKGEVYTPGRIVLWVPNAEITWSSSGMSEIGMLYAEGEDTVTFGSEPGIWVVYPKDKIRSIRKLDD